MTPPVQAPQTTATTAKKQTPLLGKASSKPGLIERIQNVVTRKKEDEETHILLRNETYGTFP